MWAGFNGMLATLLAAVGAHREVRVEWSVLLTVFETANRFHFYHALALFGLGLWLRSLPGRAKLVSAWGFSLGLVLFCGPLYVYAFSGDKVLGWLTPVGGSCLLLGWLSLAFAAWREGQSIIAS